MSMTKPKFFLTVAFALALAGALIGCSQFGSRTDAQIAGDIQSKIAADSAVPTKAVTVQAASGVVTLSGTVTSDAERTAAANDAAQVSGVKTVVNNLQVGTAAAQAQPAAQAPVAAPAPAPVAVAQEQPRARVKPVAARQTARREPALEARPKTRDYSDDPPAQQAPAQPPVITQAAAPAPAAPAPPPVPEKITVPDGTMLSIRLVDPIDTATNHQGDVFHATLDSPIVVDDKIVIPAGADVQGQITAAKSEGKYLGQSALALELSQVNYNGHQYSLHTNQYTREGSSRSKNTAEKVGAGAAVGAVLGGIFGGGKGAAIGAASGAGVGGAAQTIKKAEPIRLPSETLLSFRLENSVTVTPAATLNRDSGRRRMEP